MKAKVVNSIFWPAIGEIVEDTRHTVTIEWPCGSIGLYTKAKGEIEYVWPQG